ncbi:hypothetical protein SAMN02745941_02225 [Clostridium intestinale DSM 6191]|uniref:Uncharacterized protein n=1 Tax=Clostridium intestinale DSM 6191 TaxID=1121320 RepID=A0A1M5YR61_9CLOT|nr:hypothetical protein SAMN02745941_02225 [Clostridium intestinale DSM 6191]
MFFIYSHNHLDNYIWNDIEDIGIYIGIIRGRGFGKKSKAYIY